MIYSKRHEKRKSALQFIDVRKLENILAAKMLATRLAYELKMPVAYFSDLSLEDLQEVAAIVTELS